MADPGHHTLPGVMTTRPRVPSIFCSMTHCGSVM